MFAAACRFISGTSDSTAFPADSVRSGTVGEPDRVGPVVVLSDPPFFDFQRYRGKHDADDSDRGLDDRGDLRSHPQPRPAAPLGRLDGHRILALPLNAEVVPSLATSVGKQRPVVWGKRQPAEPAAAPVEQAAASDGFSLLVLQRLQHVEARGPAGRAHGGQDSGHRHDRERHQEPTGTAKRSPSPLSARWRGRPGTGRPRCRAPLRSAP